MTAGAHKFQTNSLEPTNA